MRDPQVRFDERDLETEPYGYRARSRLYPEARLARRPRLGRSLALPEPRTYRALPRAMQACKKRVLVVGYGNPLRGDDALGWEIAGRLATAIHDETVEVLAVSQLTPELSELISEVELVVFIDASLVGQPGSWKCQTVDPNPRSSPALGHHLTPMGLLAYAQAIFKASPRALLVSVAGDSFDCCRELTPSVAAALPAVERFVRGQIAGSKLARETTPP